MTSIIRVAMAGLLGFTLAPSTPLVAQTNLTATATAPTAVALKWTAANTATGYWVQRALGTGGFTSITPAKLQATTYTDAAAPVGSALRYRIRVTHKDGPATYSNKVTVNTPAATGPATPTTGPPGLPTTQAPLRLAEAAPVTAPRLVPAVAPAGPAPRNLRVQAQGPMVHTLAWDRLAGVSGYLVAFQETSGGPFRPVTAQPILAEKFEHPALIRPGAQYRVTALYGDGRQGAADLVYANPPQPQTPAGFTAKQTGPGQVSLTWEPVPFAKTYRVFGTGQPLDGLVVPAAGTTLSNLADGNHSWQVTADYGGVYQGADLPAVSVTLVTAKSGRYRVVANGFRVLHETYDHMLERDGKRDEVYGAFTTFHYDRKTGQLLDRDLRRTQVLGDINNMPGRIRAGTASPAGGLKTGDSYPTGVDPSRRNGAEPSDKTFPFAVWEGSLTEGADAAIIMPTLWEWDDDDAAFDFWYASEVSNASQIWLDPTMQQALKSPSLGLVVAPGSVSPSSGPTFTTATIWGTIFAQTWIVLLAGSQDRAIGMGGLQTPALPRRAIVLTREIIESTLNGPATVPAQAIAAPWLLPYLTVPQGTIAITLIDQAVPHQRLEGVYVLYLQVERM